MHIEPITTCRLDAIPRLVNRKIGHIESLVRERIGIGTEIKISKICCGMDDANLTPKKPRTEVQEQKCEE